ncbi:hypothetical protein ACPXCX_45455, partial [Streptomyces sp. DT225]
MAVEFKHAVRPPLLIMSALGGAMAVTVLLPGGRRLTDAQLRYMTWAAVTAAVWAAASAALLILTLSDLFAQPVVEILRPSVLADFVVTDTQGRSYAAMTAAGMVLATVCLGIST